MMRIFRQSVFRLMMVMTVGIGCVASVLAQPGPGPDTRSPRERALIDITGQWVAVVNEDWRWRMLTAPVGDTSSLPMNALGREVATAWDLEKDKAEGNLCRAFGPPGLIRQPTRIRVDWQDDSTLRLAFDAGTQERLLHFNAQQAPPAADSLQGFSAASWYRQRMSRGVLGAGSGTPGGSLHVQTTHMTPGYLRQNGVPYSDQATMKEFISTFALPDGEAWMIVTTVVQDPVYLSQELILSTQFRKETDPDGWDPRSCDIQPPRVVRPPTTPSPFG